MRLNLRDFERDNEKALYALGGKSCKKSWNDRGKSSKVKNWKNKESGQSLHPEEDGDSKRK